MDNKQKLEVHSVYNIMKYCNKYWNKVPLSETTYLYITNTGSMESNVSCSFSRTAVYSFVCYWKYTDCKSSVFRTCMYHCVHMYLCVTNTESMENNTVFPLTRLHAVWLFFFFFFLMSLYLFAPSLSLSLELPSEGCCQVPLPASFQNYCFPSSLVAMHVPYMFHSLGLPLFSHLHFLITR